MLSFDRRSKLIVASLLAGTAVAVAQTGCGSDNGSAGSTGAPVASGTGSASGAGTGATAATSTATAAATADFSKRELNVFELDNTLSELPPLKSDAPPREKIQKVFRHLAGGKDAYCGAHMAGPLICWGSAPAVGAPGAFIEVALGDKFVCALDNKGAISCFPEGVAPKISASPATSASATASAAPTATASAAPTASAADSASPSATASAAPEVKEVKYKTIAGGPTQVCAADRDGHAACWGVEGACSLPAPPADMSFRSLSVGTCHACGRDANGNVRCWGPEGSAAATPPAALVAKAIASGDGFSCAIDSKAALVCWGKAPDAPKDLPADLEQIGARGQSICVLGKNGALACWGGLSVNKPGPYTAITVGARSACAAVGKDKLECFGSDAEKQLEVPEDTSAQTVLDAGRTPEQIAANKKKRADTFRELLSKLPALAGPIKLDRSSKVPVGGVVAEGYLPVIDLRNFDAFYPENNYHYGFSVQAPDKKFQLIVVHDKKAPTLMAFNAEGKRTGRLTLASRTLNTPEQSLFDCGDVVEEVVQEAEIGADQQITVKTTSTLEVLGRLKSKEGFGAKDAAGDPKPQVLNQGKVKNFCKVRETTDVYAVSPTGSIDRLKSKTETPYDKIDDAACKGRWLKSPRNESYTPQPTTSEVCMCRMDKSKCPQ